MHKSVFFWHLTMGISSTHCLAKRPWPSSHRGKLGQRSQGCDRKPPIMGPACVHRALRGKLCLAAGCTTHQTFLQLADMTHQALAAMVT